jgi:hypothetical protein
MASPTTVRSARSSQRVQGKPRDAGHARKVLIESEDAGVMFQSYRRDQRINGRKCETFRASQAEQCRRLAIRPESARFEHFPLTEMVLDLRNVAGESLQHFGDDDSRGGKRLRLSDHPTQFSAGPTG